MTKRIEFAYLATASVLCRKETIDFHADLKHPERIQNYDIFIILFCLFHHSR